MKVSITTLLEMKKNGHILKAKEGRKAIAIEKTGAEYKSQSYKYLVLLYTLKRNYLFKKKTDYSQIIKDENI